MNDVSMLLRRAMPAILAILGVLAQPHVTLASCIELPPLEEAIAGNDIVFVGVVTGTTNEGRWATVQIIEVWKGTDLPQQVNVTGGLEPGTASSVDRTFEVGRRYLFLPFGGDGVLEDNACSPTQLYTPELDRLRPADAHPPVGAPPTEQPTREPLDLSAPLAAAALAALGVGAIALLVWRRRPSRGRPIA